MSAVELSRRLGLAQRHVLARLRRLERFGVVRGYHAAIGRGLDQPLLIALRFPWTVTLPEANQLHELPGVRVVHVLANGWDYLLEADVALTHALGVEGTASRGHTNVLGETAVYEVWTVSHQYRRTGERVRRLDLPSARGVPSQRVRVASGESIQGSLDK